MEVASLAAIVAIIKKLVDFGRYLANFQQYKSAVISQVVAWVGGIALAFVVAHSEWAAAIPVGHGSLKGLGWGSLVWVGLGFASLASVAADTTRAVDHTDSAMVPELPVDGPAVADEPVGAPRPPRRGKKL